MAKFDSQVIASFVVFDLKSEQLECRREGEAPVEPILRTVRQESHPPAVAHAASSGETLLRN
jgi:hypothetical protein